MPAEDWPTFADDLKTLADKAFSDLSEDARERLAVDRWMIPSYLLASAETASKNR